MNEPRTYIAPQNPDYPVSDRFSWSAILAGVFMTLALFLSLSSLGLSLGLAVMSFEGGISLTASTWFSSIWLVLSFLGSLGFATYFTARLSNQGSYLSGVLNGLTVWAVTSVFIFYAATKSSAQIIASSGQAVIEQLQGVAQPMMSNIGKSMGNGSIEDMNLEYFEEVYKDVDAPELKKTIKKELKILKRDAQKTARKILKNPNAAQSSLNQLKSNAQESLTRLRAEYDREKIAGIIARNSEMTQAEVEKASLRWEQKLDDFAAEMEDFYVKVEEEVIEAADSAKNSVAATSFLMFLFLCLGFIVAIFASSKACRNTKAIR